MAADDNDTELELGDLREKIDSLDLEILQRLNERAQCALRVAEVKQAASPDVAPICMPSKVACLSILAC